MEADGIVRFVREEALIAEIARLRQRLARAEQLGVDPAQDDPRPEDLTDARFLRSILASSADCIKVLDLDAKLTFMSEGGQRVMEVGDFNAIQGCPWPDFWQGPGNAKALAAVEAAKAGGTGSFQGVAETMGGTPRYWDVRVTPILGPDGHPEKLLSVSRDVTATRQAEEALRRAECLNTLILSSSRDCIVVLDLDGNTESVSPGGLEAMEVSDTDAVLGISWLRVWHGSDHDAARVAVEAARAGGIGRFQGFCPTHRGAARWWDVVVSPLRGMDGRPERLVAVGRDITERRRAEQLLALSEERLKLALGAAGTVGIWDWDLKSDLIRADANLARIYTIDPDRAAQGAPIGEYIRTLHPEDMAAFQAELDRVFAIAEDFTSEYRLLQPGGSVRWILARGRMVRDAEGIPVRFLGASVDITDRKQSEIRQAFLLELADRLRALTDPREIMAAAAAVLGRQLAASQVGYGMVQPDDETIRLETSYADGVQPLAGSYKLTAFGTGSVSRHRRGQTIVLDDVAGSRSREAATWDAAHARSVVSVPLIRDGRFRASLYVVHASARAWSVEEVALIEDVASRTWDAVERARAEATLRDSNEMLEQRIATALAEQEKIEETLRQAQKMEAVGQLTGGLAHDFNNLLTAITGSLEMLGARLAEGRTIDLDRYINAALRASTRAAALTHRLLAFSRRQTLDPKPTDVNCLVADMEELIRRTVGPTIEIDVVGAAGVWPALVDPNQLENALLNLCINARDAMPDGGRIAIETANRWLDELPASEQEPPPGQYLSLSVTDTGTGMTPEVIERAFDPFFTTKPLGEGTGLGLSMIYGFARQSGGKVGIASELGRGTTISLYLPHHAGAADSVEEVAEVSGKPRAGHGETVLVVDDEPIVRMLVAEVLTDLGYRTIEAANGAAGLERLRSEARIDLLITDVGLPGGMNGRQVADAGRAMRPGLKVLFITGYAENSVIGDGQLEPGMQVLTKPFAMEMLAHRIRDLLTAR